ncbi:MAG: MBL fold hydrolase [Micavibrio sp.]|nr:MBL fold hydrolase [Micavibrio sp.]
MEKLKLDPDVIHFIPLGGSEEFGCNFNIYAYKGKFLIMDCGIGFADHRMPLVDILLPKPDFIEQYKDDIVGLVVTHGHEDHIGAVPYLWPRLECPVYGSGFTMEIMRRKLRDFPEAKAMPLHQISKEATLSLEPFTLEFLGITHSIPENISTVIRTDAGTILHTGDWNLDPDPQVGEVTEQKRFEAIGREGVLAYIGDSTNAMVEGRTPSEQEVEEGLTHVFAEQDKMIAVTTFSSNIGRIKSIARAAEKNGRSVAVIGRSLQNMVGAAKVCGFLDDIQDFVDFDDLNIVPRSNLVVILTGSQGEARAALSRVARGDYRGLNLEKGDTVIFSSRDIPGNEKDINEIKNALIGSGVKVITDKSTEHIIHVSGHPCREELREMMSWARPKIAVPVHGESMMVRAHARLAEECGVTHSVIPKNGAVIRLDPNNPEIIDHVETGFLGVEPARVVDADSPVIAMRRKLQYTGVAMVTAILDRQASRVEDVQFSSLGLEEEDSEDETALFDEVSDTVEYVIKRNAKKKALEEDHQIAEVIRIEVRRLLAQIYGFKPKVIIHLVREA